MVELIGAPYDLGGRSRGAALGPAAMRLAGLNAALGRLGLDVVDRGNLPIEALSVDAPGIRDYDSAMVAYRSVKRAVSEVLARRHTPIMLGGDHSLALASVAAALEAFGNDLFLLWIDAHADLNCTESSPSGNLHGMPVGALVRRPCDNMDDLAAQQWQALLDEIVPASGLSPERVGWIGLRDVDQGELDLLKRWPRRFAATMDDVDQWGIPALLERLWKWAGPEPIKLWVSFDVDSLDPILAPGTGTVVLGGLTYREGHHIAELLYSAQQEGHIQLIGADVVEVNPSIDTNNQTAVVAVEWLCSLFGQKILKGYEGIID